MRRRPQPACSLTDIKYQPVPLESDTGDSSILARGVASQNHGVMDFDGDGIPDAIARPRGSDNSISFLWNVWLGDRTGGFGPQRFIFPTRNGPNNRISGFGLSWGATASSSDGLLDINGDGLPDHWLTPDFTTLHNANIAFHDGTQHRLVGQTAPAVPTGERETPSSPPVKPGSDTIASSVLPQPLGSQPIESGRSETTNRVVDVDGDGRVDVVGNVTSFPPQVFFNLGGQFNATPVSLVGDASGFKRRVQANNDAGTWTWHLQSDLIDLDGNGIPESVTFPSADSIARAEHNPLAPPRLMWKIKNNRGAETTISYASMHDRDVVKRSDVAPSPNPTNQWIVKSMTIVDHVPTDVSSTTSYVYKDPHHGPDDENRHAFRGFGEVATTSPSGSKLVQRYSYAPDWSGRLSTSLVIPAEAPTTIRSMEKTTWEERQLFGGALRTYHATMVERFNCANGQTEATCTASAAPGYTRSTSTLSALASTTDPGAPLVWQETSSLLQGGTSAADGDRESIKTFAFKADVAGGTTSYRLRALTSTRNHRVGGTMTMFGKSATTWDPDFLC